MSRRPTGSVLRARLAVRHAALGALRGFLEARGSIETETPARIAAPAPERHIRNLASEDRYLAASPELQMKRLVADGSGRIHQIARSFRGDERGRHHHTEFTLLDWYLPGCDYRTAIAETEAAALAAIRAVREAARGALGGEDPYGGARRRPAVDPDGAFERTTVREAFARQGAPPPPADIDDDAFCRFLVDRVEPALPPTGGVFLIDYPASQASLARLSPADPAVCERFELYLGGLETANGFTELADEAEQRRRFDAERSAIAVARGRPGPLDERFLEAVGRLGSCAGVALGVDRLIMAALGVDELEAVRPGGWEDEG
jgi:lysyl-tRNA synthetase class 2